MMKVLVYMEQWIEKSDPGYRLSSFCVDQQRIINALIHNRNDVQVKCLVGDGIVHTDPGRIAKTYEKHDVAIIEQSELKSILGNYKSAAKKSYWDTLTQTEVDALACLYSEKLEGFRPDVIFVFESSSNHLKRVYPDALVITQYFSPLSREPFPRLHVFDVHGIFQHSLTTIASEELRNKPTSAEATNFMDQLRRRYFSEIISSYDPIANLIESKKKEFDHLVLMPLQGSNYFAFEENSESLDLFSYICDVLDEIDPRIGVIVTEHTARERVVTEKNIAYLQNKYPNFIYFKEFNEIRFHSQFLLNHVDAIITVTSSLAFLAAIRNIPCFNIGKFQSFVSASSDVSKIYHLLEGGTFPNFDGAFYYLFNHVYVPDVSVKTPHLLQNYLFGLIRSARGSEGGLRPYDSLLANCNLQDQIILGDREKKFREGLSSVHSDSTLEVSEKLEVVSPDVAKKLLGEKGVKVVSFDLFDTLVVRPFHRPRSLFKFIEADVAEILRMPKFEFGRLRGKVEKRLRQKRKKDLGYWREVRLEEIYDELASIYSWTDQEKSEVMALEIETEIRLCRPREYIMEVLEYAKSKQHKIVITTDTYLPRAVIQRLLNNCGIRGYDELIVSSEFGVRKQDGRLYDVLIEKANVPAKSILHIGDNREADGTFALKYGVRACIIASVINRFLPSGGRVDAVWSNRDDCLNASTAVGLIANIAESELSNLRQRKNTLFDINPKIFGLHAFGPLLHAFAYWLHRKSRQHNLQTLYFLSREGLVLKRAYDLVRDAEGTGPTSLYLRASRRAALLSAVRTVEDLQRVVFLKMSRASLRHILSYKLGLDDAESYLSNVLEAGFPDLDHLVDPGKERKQLNKLIVDLFDPIMASAAREREGMLAYLKAQGLSADSANDCALVDVGYAGTIQLSLGKLLGTTPHGLYLGTTLNPGRQISEALCDGFIFRNVDLSSDGQSEDLSYHRFVSHYEGLLCAPEPSLKRVLNGIDGVDFEFNSLTPSKKYIAFIEQVHEGALSYIAQSLQVFGSKSKLTSLQTPELLEVATAFFSAPQYDEARMLQALDFDNQMGAEHAKQFLPKSKRELRDALKMGDLTSLSKKYIWKEGVDAMLSYVREEDGFDNVIPIKGLLRLI